MLPTAARSGAQLTLQATGIVVNKHNVEASGRVLSRLKRCQHYVP